MMTLTIAWVRKLTSYSEMLVASDSRLTGTGFIFDSAPKILSLPRKDCVVAFAGDTAYAYPFMIHAYESVLSYYKSLSRAMDLESLKGHLIRVFNNILSERSEFANRDLKDVKLDFILAGYCWKHARFEIFRIHFDKHIGRFTFQPTPHLLSPSLDTTFAMVGNYVDEAKEELKQIMFEKFGKPATGAYFDLEPLEVLKKMIDNREYREIGGNVQVYKVYQYLNSTPVAIKRNDVVSGFGRQLLDYEQTSTIIDLDRKEIRMSEEETLDKDV